MILWLILAILTGAAALWLIRPLIMSALPAADSARAGAYRGVLEAVERDRAGALLGADDAAAERAVIARALIAEAAPSSPLVSAKPARTIVLGLVMLMPLAAAALYLGTGRGPDGKFSAVSYASQTELEGLARRFEKRVADNPGDAQGYRLLALAQAGLGRVGDAAQSFARVLALGNHTSNDLMIHAALLIRLEGKVVPRALAELDEALTLDPANSAARSDRASAREAVGDYAGAREDWLYLENIAPKPEWKAGFAERAEEAARATQSGAAPPVQADAQAAMIEGMVARLAQRLKANPQDLQGWLKLIHSYVVLGARDKATAAADDARKLFGQDPAAASAIDAEAGALK
jgi:cytochrome c-type biogenesis protein CcmH